jgi:hypothetical protein
MNRKQRRANLPWWGVQQRTIHPSDCRAAALSNAKPAFSDCST